MNLCGCKLLLQCGIASLKRLERVLKAFQFRLGLCKGLFEIRNLCLCSFLLLRLSTETVLEASKLLLYFCLFQ